MQTATPVWMAVDSVDRIARLPCAMPPDNWMSASEQARQRELAAPRRRDQFVAGRWLLRQLLQSAFGQPWQHWRTQAHREAPPRLLHLPASARPVFLSVSHSGDQVAAAVAHAPIGIDIETPTRGRDIHALAQAVFTSAELGRLGAMTCRAAQQQHFYAVWTLKEAWLKSLEQALTLGRMLGIGTRQDPQGTGRLWRHQGTTLALVAPVAAHCVWMNAEPPTSAGRWRINDSAMNTV